MKKNKALRIGSCLAVVALLSTCLVAGTFAKYTTSGTSQDTARVAKWGVTVQGAAGAFNSVYDAEDSATVKSENGTDKVVAPGTKATLAANTLSGKPEVSVKVTNTGSFALSDGWTLNDGSFYCPIKVTVPQSTGDDKVLSGLDYSSKDAFVAAVNGAIGGYEATYAANTNLSGAAKVSPEVSWEWTYDNGTGTAKTQTDENDTYLTTKADAPTITLGVTTTVIQID